MDNLSKSMETAKKDTVKILKLKNTISEIKKTLDKFNSLLNPTEKISSEPKDRLTDINYPKIGEIK